MHATAEAAKIRGGATYLAYRQGPLFLFPCLRVHLYNPLLPLAHLGFLSRRARPTLRTPSTAPAARRSSSAEESRRKVIGTPGTSFSRSIASRSHARSVTECQSARSKEPLARPRGKLTADFEVGAAHAEDRQRRSLLPRRDQLRPGGGRSRRSARVKPGKTPSASPEKKEGTRYT